MQRGHLIVYAKKYYSIVRSEKKGRHLYRAVFFKLFNDNRKEGDKLRISKFCI